MAMAMGLFSKLQSLNVTDYRSILRKTLSLTDLNPAECRLLLTKKLVEKTPLLSNVLNSTEHVQLAEGLAMRTFDQNGKEYNMLFRYLDSNRAFRLIHAWSDFLSENKRILQVGDELELCTFRIPKEGHASELGMALIHHPKRNENTFIVPDIDREDKGRRTVKRKKLCVDNKVKEEEEGINGLSPEERTGIESLKVMRKMALASQALSKEQSYAMGFMYFSDFQGN